MTLDEFIQKKVAAHVSDLGRLAAAPINEYVERKKTILLVHLRDLFRLRRSSFSPELIESLKHYASDNVVRVEAKALPEGVEDEIEAFEIGKKYLSEHGIFEVRKNSPYPVIDPPLYPKCQTPYFASYMLEEHNRLVATVVGEYRAAEKFAEQFNPPEISAAAEIENLTASYHSMVEKNHKNFLRDHGKPDLGTRSTSNKFRVTHCYSCKNELDSELYMECRSCGWIICSCGACGCGYEMQG